MARKKPENSPDGRADKGMTPTSLRLSPDVVDTLSRLAKDYDLERSNAVNAGVRLLAKTLDRASVKLAKDEAKAARKKSAPTP